MTVPVDAHLPFHASHFEAVFQVHVVCTDMNIRQAQSVWMCVLCSLLNICYFHIEF